MNQNVSKTGLCKPWMGLLIAMWVALLAVTPLPAAADISAPKPSAKSDVNESSGAFSEALEIEVPAFRGLEPKLALSYSSAGGNGFVGAGWSLSGLSFIERVSKGGGMATYTSNDVYMLDGEELVRGCTILRGTHCTKHQSYQRITFDSTKPNGGEWYVRDKDGSRRIYRALMQTGAQTVRWALVDERDTHDNHVYYQYDCTSAEWNCYPKSITYNNATIRFYSEDRPDIIDFATPLGISQGVKRLRSIAVKVGTSHARAYKLSYTSSAANGRSLLQSVQQYGDNVQIDINSGAITGGSALPVISMAYTSGATGLTYGAPTGLGNAMLGDGEDRHVTGDFNGDGKLDSANIRPGWVAWRVSLGMGVGGVDDWQISGGVANNVFEAGYASGYHMQSGDFNGDGRTDIAVTYAGWASFKLYLSNGSGFTVADWGVSASNDLLGDGHDYMVSGDFNGDGKTDIAWTRPAWGGWQVALSTGGGFARGPWGGVNSLGLDDHNHLQTGDFNGDGKTDIAYTRPGWHGWGMYLSTGADFTTQDWSTSANLMGHDALNYVVSGDFNGDGYTDLAYARPGWSSVDVFISMGTGFRRSHWSIGNPNGMDMAGGNFVQSGDFNGDGKTDIAWTYPGWDGWQVYLSTFEAFGHVTWGGLPANGLTATGFNPIVAGDFDGDGNTDLGYTTAGMGGWVRHLGSGDKPDLLSSINNGMTGSTTIGYKPSSSWSTTYMPVGSVSQTVSSITVRDGRGLVDTTRYSYWGAKWSDTLDRPLGYAKSQEQRSDGSYTDYFFYQTTASPGELYREDIYANGGVPMHSSVKNFTENDTAPYTSLLTKEESHEYNGSTAPGTFQTTRKEFGYDEYGNVNRIYDYDDGSSVTTTTATTFYPNLDSYIVDKPAYLIVYAGAGTGGAVLSKERNIYDSSTSASGSPTFGNITKAEHWNNITNSYLVKGSYAYDGYGNQISETDALGRVATTVYSDPATAAYPNVYPVMSCADPGGLNQCTRTTWDLVLGLPVNQKDANAAVVRTEYDEHGRKVLETVPSLDPLTAKATTWRYLDFGVSPSLQRVEERLPDGSSDGLWNSVYIDGLGRPWKAQKKGLASGQHLIQTTIYKAATSLVLSKSDWYVNGTVGGHSTSMEYDALGRLTKTTHPDGQFVTVAYANGTDGKPYVTTVREMGQQTRVWQDADGNVTRIKETDTAEYFTTLTYDLLGRKTKVVDDAGNETWRATYNSLGHKLSDFDPNRGTRTYKYNAAGQLERETDAKGQETELTYDRLGRLSTKATSDGGLTTWFYDEPASADGSSFGASIGRLTRIVYPGGSKEQAWDIRGLQTRDKHCIGSAANCRTFVTKYDSMGRQYEVTYPDMEKVLYAYDRAGQLLSVKGAKDYVTGMTWTPNQQLASMSYGNGMVNSYLYDGERKWLTSASARTAAGVRLYHTAYDYDASGRVTLFTRDTSASTAVTTTYTYDGLDRLKSAKGGSNQNFSYNSIGNILSNSSVGSYDYHPVRKHAVTSAGGKAYTYDANGNMLSGAGGAYTMTWDAQERMASLTKGGTVAVFAYDEGEQRVRKTVGGVDHYYFDARAEQNGAAAEQYYYAGPILVARKKTAGATSATRWYHADRLGSTRLMTSEIAESVKEYDYRPFGYGWGTSGTEANERGYTGHVEDDETGLVYMNARYYDPLLAKFVSADSIVGNENNPQDYNRYSYVNNNPINNTDPTGHMSLSPDERAGEAAAAAGVLLYLGARIALRQTVKTAKGAGRLLKRAYSRKNQGTRGSRPGRVHNSNFAVAGTFVGGASAFANSLANGDGILKALRNGAAGAGIGYVSAGIPLVVAAVGRGPGITAAANILAGGLSGAASYVASHVMNRGSLKGLDYGHAGVAALIGHFAAYRGVVRASHFSDTGGIAILLGLTHRQAARVVGERLGVSISVTQLVRGIRAYRDRQERQRQAERARHRQGCSPANRGSSC